jgi:hypothetical protein
MKMRRSMILKKHLDQDTVKYTNGGHYSFPSKTLKNDVFKV